MADIKKLNPIEPTNNQDEIKSIEETQVNDVAPEELNRATSIPKTPCTQPTPRPLTPANSHIDHDGHGLLVNWVHSKVHSCFRILYALLGPIH